MHFVFVNATKIWSGVKTWILTLGTELVQRGHQVSVVAYPGVFVDVCQQQGLEVLPLRFGFDGNPWVIARLIRWFVRHNADCIVTNVDKDIYVAGIAARCMGARVVNHIGAPSDVKSKGKQALIRARLIDLFIVPSAWAAAETQARAPWLQPPRMRVLYNPVDVTRFSPRVQPPEAEPSPLRIGITGRLVRTKGHQTLIQAIRLLPGDVRANVRVEIAGAGPLEPALHAMVQAAHLTDTVRFVGFVTDPERFLQQLDIAVFPSLADSFCLAALEAMSCGLPVVASSVGGIPELIHDADTGLLVPPEEPQRLAESLTRLCRNAALRQELGRNARREAESRFAIDHIVEQFEALCATPSGRLDSTRMHGCD
jgi:glycosyltransferase involved in cell wall biosynthesis